jgi:aconitate hydratase
MSKNSFDCLTQLNVSGKEYHYFDLNLAAEHGLSGISKLPFSLKVLLENLLRHEDSVAVKADHVRAFSAWLQEKKSSQEIAYHPARVLLQDFTGVPAVVDLAAMRDAMVALGHKADAINPLCPVDLVIDHSVQVDAFGARNAYDLNVKMEMQRNFERYAFLKWGKQTFDNFSAVPPGTGICHQVNLEYIAKTVWTKQVDDKTYAFPDTLVGTDSHTTMVNGLGVLGWGVGGIEAEAAMLGQPVSMLIPEVIGMKLVGKLSEGITATDLVLTVTQMLREKGVVGKFVEYFGDGLAELPLADRATLSNMAPEYGATCGIFPIDEETIKYLRLSNRDEDTVALVEAYAKAQGMWRTDEQAEYTDTLELDLSTVEPSLAGPKRPQDKVAMSALPKKWREVIADFGKAEELDREFVFEGDQKMRHGDVVIAAITSCTNTSNPSVMVAAGLVAKKAVAKGLKIKPWVKTSLAPGSKVVTEYLQQAGLTESLDQLGFALVGYGCTTCIGNSGPLPESVSKTVADNDLVACSVLSGNRNFEGRIHPLVKANWLSSPPLVVAYALAGSIRHDMATDPLGVDINGDSVYLKDIWPSQAEIQTAMQAVSSDMFAQQYASVFDGTQQWQDIEVTGGATYAWQADSTYVKSPPFFTGMTMQPDAIEDVHAARVLALLGDSVTTDHISPAGSIKPDSPAGLYLKENGVSLADFNSYGSRRGNHEVMMRGTFANIRIRNQMLDNVEGGYTKYLPTGEQMSIYDAAMRYQADNTPLVVIAGKEYGTGSSRDWAAKGTLLLGVKAVIAESYERIHRSNLIGMGVLPLQFMAGDSRQTLQLCGDEEISVLGIADVFTPGMQVTLKIKRGDGTEQELSVLSRIDTENEAEYYRHGGILCYVLRNMAS